MYKDICVLIIEDDPYARDLMAMLLARDWRTRVIGEIKDLESARQFISENAQPVDVVILDTEIPSDPDWAFHIAAEFQSLPEPPRILFTATQVDLQRLKRITSGSYSGCLVKEEVLYSLATAVSQCSQGNWVTTPAVAAAIPDLAAIVGQPVSVVDGAKPVAKFTQRENEIIRLGLLFNLTHRDVADELVVSPIWVSEVISNAYEKLGLREMVAGELAIDDAFEDEAVAARIRSLLDRPSKTAGKNLLRRTPWLSALAFHTLTIPEIERIAPLNP